MSAKDYLFVLELPGPPEHMHLQVFSLVVDRPAANHMFVRFSMQVTHGGSCYSTRSNCGLPLRSHRA